MTTATAKIIEQSEKMGLYSIKFNDSDIIFTFFHQGHRQQ